MSPCLNDVDHGAAARVLEGVVFEKGTNVPAELITAQPLESGSDEPTQDGVGTKISIDKVVAACNELIDEGKENTALDEQTSLAGQVQVRSDEKPKKKKKNSGRTKGAKKRGTGFEDYFCDPPLTPEEAKEEKSTIYAPDRPFVDRIERCIQRYRARRRMDNNKENLFNKYLNLGGIDTAPRMFQSMNTINYEESTNDEIRGMTAGDVIHRGAADVRFYDPNESDHWDVDFAGVAAGFFSERIFKLVGTDMGVIQMAVDVVTNFLNYILHHDVCPEHADNIMKAKGICNSAVDQISRGFKITRSSPGDFNRACQVLFGTNKNSFAEYDDFAQFEAMPMEHAQRVFFASVAAHDILYGKVKGNKTEDIKVVDQVTQTFEVEEVSLPTEAQVQMYLGVKDGKGATGNIKPCGLLALKPIDLVTGWDRGDATGFARGIEPHETFVLDSTVLEHLTVGMKVKLVVCTLNIGIKFIKGVQDVRPTYYTFLPQELMLRYREPVPNDRPAPSVENPEMDEGGKDDKDE